MKKAIFIMIMGLMNCAFAAKVPETVLVNIDFDYQKLNPQSEVFLHAAIKNHLQMLTDDHRWVKLTGEIRTRNGDTILDSKGNPFILLARIDEADTEKFKIEFLMAGGTSDHPTIVARPVIMVNYGQKGQVVLNQKNEKIALSVSNAQPR